MKIILTTAVIHTTQAVVKLKPEKKFSLNVIRTHDLCDTSAVIQLCLYVERIILG